MKPDDHRWKVAGYGKPITLSPKEIDRADGDFTVVTRPQADGGYMVGVVKIQGTQGTLVFKPVYVESQADLAAEIKDQLRTLDQVNKSQMADRSRHRQAADEPTEVAKGERLPPVAQTALNDASLTFKAALRQMNAGNYPVLLAMLGSVATSMSEAVDFFEGLDTEAALLKKVGDKLLLGKGKVRRAPHG